MRFRHGEKDSKPNNFLALAHDFKISVDSNFTKDRTKKAEKMTDGLTD